jgi:predicted transcriptional regulator
MKPMGLNSTLFISYHEIDVDEIDLIEDAWGINSEFCDVIELLGHVKIVTPGRLTKKLIEKVRKQV